MEKSDKNIWTYGFRLYPSQKQVKKLESQLLLCKELYNILLKKCMDEYKINKKSMNRKRLFKTIKEINGKDTRLNAVHSQVLQNVANRIIGAYANFFRRVKEKKRGKNINVGFPRFKKHYISMTYPQSGFKFISGNRLFASKIGNIPAVFHRKIEGTIKTMTIKITHSGRWFVFFNSVVDILQTQHPNKNSKIGIDVGLENFATLSDGTKIENPRFAYKSEKQLTKYQQKLSRKERGSKNRYKAKIKVAKMYEKITNQRTDFLHKIANDITTKYGFVAAEKLNIRGLIHNHNLARSISDASWNQFTQMLCYKASSAGCQVVLVDPRGTSQICSGCGNKVSKELSDRWHDCQECGLFLHRDHNSALEILNKATAGLAESNASGDRIRPSVKKAVVDESGTKRVEIDAGIPV